ncbi:hypothetical protein PENSPDRAFT_204182 [Peniophora sp. CONT]|nr:hypothetical protein PENSPDRAFT_204182 [Peniophora sp. CONT]
MMFPITCNAVGDIITLASLVLDITRALNEARGSASEYRVFIAELNTLHILLTSVARVAQDSIDGALRSEILAEIDRCGCHIRYALERIAKFSVLSHDAAASDGLRVKFKRQLYKIEWRFARRSDIQAVRADLSIATQRLTALLIVANADAAAYLHASMSNQFETLAVRMGALASDHYRIAAERDAALSRTVMARGNTEVAGSFQTAAQPDHALVHELFSNAPEGIDAKIAAVAVLCVAVCTVHDTHHVVHTAMLLAAICLLLRSAVRQGRGPVQAIAYTALNSITLNDALGRRLTLPLELCGTYDVFHATLVNLFSSSKGNWFIHAGAYEIADVHSGTVVCREDWHASVRTGAEIEMTVIVHQLSCGSNRSQCPWCLDFVFEGCKSRSHCKACGRAFDTDGGDWTPFSAPTLDDSSSHEQDHTYYATDKGRFPRDRPSHTPILQHGAAFHSSGSSSQTLPGRGSRLQARPTSLWKVPIELGHLERAERGTPSRREWTSRSRHITP